MIAFLPQECWRKHIPRQMSQRTAHTIASLESLLAELEKTRKRGYAVEREENEAGAVCLGAPIFDQDGHVIAALSLSAPTTRVALSIETEVGEAVVSSAYDISVRLGYARATPKIR